MSDKKTYYCLNAVRHNGQRFTDTIDLTADEAKPLLAVKAITKNNPKAAGDAETVVTAPKKASKKASKQASKQASKKSGEPAGEPSPAEEPAEE